MSKREREAERYILSTLPTFYAPLYKKDGASFISADKYGHLCTVTGALWTPQGRSFDGDDDIITFTPAGFSTGNIPITLEAWVNPTTVSGKNILHLGTRSVNRSYLMHFGMDASGDLSLSLWGPDWRSAGGKVSAGVMQHVVISYDAVGAPKGYVNAVDVGTMTPASSPTPNFLSAGSSIMARSDELAGQFTAGTIGEVRVYSRALSQLEIQQIYLATRWRYK